MDRILANTEFTSSFVDSSCHFLPRGLSDHAPGILTFKGGLRKRVYGFKFDNFIVNDVRFLEIVMQYWRVPVEGTFMFKLHA